MKYVIDETICNRNDISIGEILFGLLCKQETIIPEIIETLKSKGYLNGSDISDFYPSGDFSDKICTVLLDSDEAVPKTTRCENLAIQMRALFPKGIKTGSSAWRGNLREIALRLKKFFKIYGDNWSDDQIIEATKKYVDHFNGDYTYMRILKYFIMKSARVLDENGDVHIEDISELANWLENDIEINDDWTSSIV